MHQQLTWSRHMTSQLRVTTRHEALSSPCYLPPRLHQRTQPAHQRIAHAMLCLLLHLPLCLARQTSPLSMLPKLLLPKSCRIERSWLHIMPLLRDVKPWFMALPPVPPRPLAGRKAVRPLPLGQCSIVLVLQLLHPRLSLAQALLLQARRRLRRRPRRRLHQRRQARHPHSTRHVPLLLTAKGPPKARAVAEVTMTLPHPRRHPMMKTREAEEVAEGNLLLPSGLLTSLRLSLAEGRSTKRPIQSSSHQSFPLQFSLEHGR